MKSEITKDLNTCRALRRQVFIEEQNVPETEEWDGHDGEAIHLLVWQGDRALGTARMIIQGMTAKIGRVCVLAEARGTGLGAVLMRTALDALRDMPGITTAKLGSQTHAIGFYEKLGFTAHGPEYDDAGIPHRDMTLVL